MRSAILAATLALGACGWSFGDGDRGREASREFRVEAFDRIALAGSHDVIVTVGGAPSVRAEGNEEALDRLEIEVRDGQLRIGSRRGSGGWFRGGHRRVTVHVSAPAIGAAVVAGSGDIRIDRIEGANFRGRVAGSGDLRIERMRIETADFAIAGSGDIRAAGTVVETKVSVVGSGDSDLSGLESRAAEISVVGSGDVRLRVTERADVTVLGSGDVTVDGGARCTVNKRGSGDVRCGG